MCTYARPKILPLNTITCEISGLISAYVPKWIGVKKKELVE